MRIATYNMKHGSLKGLAAVVDALRSLGADLVALQEVDRGVLRSGGVDQPATLAAELGLGATFGPAFGLEGGQYGVCLLSRLPVRGAQVHALPSASVVPLADGVEPRIALEVSLGELTVVVPHLGLDPGERLLQVDALLARLSGRERLVLAGDLNCGPGEPPFERLLTHFADTFDDAGTLDRASFPAGNPIFAIDHVLRSRDLPPALAARVVDASASDHLPVVVDLW